ncbi:Cytochrome c oxidase caa3 assembly factor (Caa3_CtaG) [Jannaschia seosinensis]|uniref:Cytochrome c oxidase caa3 assembly factor (Caa3_CtaG) n=1 Tax=Jannaschia seosinensis TaxID=313367 RepID=A0A0M7B6Q5_9RHOB|nr:cytochrome c oxidase assembly protein [Jannaschia seosinensis]CUH11355.1 Cytochrome c oxidase caa3 assembly factor (Caa3_CtaG) [Jannaschia seosinensis]
MEGIYCGPPPVPDAIWMRWNFDPYLLAALALFALIVGRNRPGAAAIAVLAVVFVSPLCALSSALFSARVVHHVLLIAVAAPLLAWSLPAREARSPALSFAVSSAVLWAWHVPAAYDLALSHFGVYWTMQVTLLATATWFWRDVFAAARSPVDGLVFIVAGFAQMGMLGAILTFAPEALYAAHAVGPFAWGLTPLGDQQLGGLLMWVPAGLPYAVAGAVVARRGWAGLQGQNA